MEIRRVFAENLKRYRKLAGLSQEELALNASVERAYVSLLERQLNSPTIDMVSKLSKAVGVEPYELLVPPSKKKRQ
ncbi:helix-turn-helix transcriptional regulator [Hyphomonas sp.]|jgi:transcriptional regulator with XRE-family HTH domain|uniref:helix-turn-helix domain-containing protein n=1 Tax=Hyphomonas sp. TaxID=87 RepID=UPI0025BEDFD3|nr:helix-turn-helix transcriptional regulator [Hyphomonas sp.]